MAHVVLLGTLDTKAAEYGFVRDRIAALGQRVILVDVGVHDGGAQAADVDAQEVAAAAGSDLARLRATGDRAAAIATMARGATAVVRRLFEEGRLQAIAGIGGSGGTSLATAVMRTLPIGVPKVMVSTVAAGDVRDYVGCTDITMMHSVVDMAGMNRISERVLGNAAAAVAAMAEAYGRRSTSADDRPLVAATMFGVTTPCVTRSCEVLRSRGYETMVFHAVGTGGRSMEALIDGGDVAGVLDATTTELADELVGGVFPAGPGRLTAAGRRGIPQVVSLGALDMVNFGPLAAVPERFRGRRLHEHNSAVTLMRTSPEECAALGREIAGKLNAAQGPAALFVPLRGVSAVSIEGGVFYDPAADRALFDAVSTNLTSRVELECLDLAINDVRFAERMALRLDEFMQSSRSSTNERPASP